ncbi:MAG TPA: DUF1080 domain-containing protein [Candidatus Paceibacterota bacterium]|nr:DUF1080 domain-containing protein [Verrucomicrobiota bacterium]HRY47000.1 DUF1080 domain-containing protein [Candidatus Paceibacterota bacterium]HRZ99100.1 DUF1080 domain-containing protein [Candidatus Paceibacterota bacterium]
MALTQPSKAGFLFRSLILLAFISALALPSPAPAQEKPKAVAPPEPPGMTSIFNGRDLSGWEGDLRLWSVQNQVIRGATTTENPAKGNTFLIWKDGVVKDFDLRLSFRCSTVNNSGIQYRSKRKPFKNSDANRWGVMGYQAEVRNSISLPNVAGFIYDEGGKRGRMCLVGEKVVWENGQKTVVGTLCSAEDYKTAFQLDDWNEYVIIAQGNHLRHFINGLQVIDFVDKQPDLAPTEGIIGLQLHAGQPMWCEFKNIRLKPLP